MPDTPLPPATRVEVVTDSLHGHQIADSYRWLEHAENPQTVAWVEEQNAYTRALLDAVPGRDTIREQLTQILSIGAIGVPRVFGNRYFYARRDGTQNQPVLYVREGVDGADRVLLDPNTDSEEGIVSLDWWYPSWNGRYVAYGYSRDGDEWSTLRVLDVDRVENLAETIERARNASVAWMADSSAFYYTRYPFPSEAPEDQLNYRKRIFFHQLGGDSSIDPEVRVTDMALEDMPSVSTSRDGHYLVATISKGWERSDIYLRDLSTDGEFMPVAVGYDALFDAQVVDDALYLHTNLDASRYHLFRVEATSPERHRWHEVIPEGADVLQSVTLAGERILAQYLHHATSSLLVYDQNGCPQTTIDLPELGTVTGIWGDCESDEVFYSFESFTIPTTIYRCTLENCRSSVWAAVDSPIRGADCTVRQEWYASKDGTPISMFLVHRDGLDSGRPHPTLLTGYGGFNISLTPTFLRSAHLWLAHGGVYAIPNLRGGGEYGEGWHRAGMLENKQSVFDDFLAAAEHLIREGYTDSSHLAISGGSNGGLLVGAALTQRPDLFRAGVCSVPLLDMLRYHRFLIARLWTREYGSADDPDQFPFIHAYSPYHQVRNGEHYPAVLFETAESDSRVDPLHARKMTALLQAANSSEHPILLRVESRAGHGIGKPITKVIEEQTDSWTFLCWQLGLAI